MRKKFIALFALLLGVYLPSDLYGQELLNIEKVNRQPYFKFELKETEFRFNHQNNNLYKVLLKHLRDDPL